MPMTAQAGDVVVEIFELFSIYRHGIHCHM